MALRCRSGFGWSVSTGRAFLVCASCVAVRFCDVVARFGVFVRLVIDGRNPRSAWLVAERDDVQRWTLLVSLVVPAFFPCARRPGGRPSATVASPCRLLVFFLPFFFRVSFNRCPQARPVHRGVRPSARGEGRDRRKGAVLGGLRPEQVGPQRPTSLQRWRGGGCFFAVCWMLRARDIDYMMPRSRHSRRGRCTQPLALSTLLVACSGARMPDSPPLRHEVCITICFYPTMIPPSRVGIMFEKLLALPLIPTPNITLHRQHQSSWIANPARRDARGLHESGGG